MFIGRSIEEKIKYLGTKFPVITLTGIRQCGKSTLLRRCFPEYRYVSLEDLDIRQLVKDDPRGFLQNFGSKIIIDEAQYAPHLFSYIQTIVDKKNESGMYILSGSQNFLLMDAISQSLAGRTAILRLSTFSITELKKQNKLPELNDWLFTGGFPRIYDKAILPVDFFPHYMQTYIERDVRSLRNINNLSLFIRFIKLCAARTGQILNLNSLANQADITVNTAKSWLSILESSYVIYLLKPYYKNFNKRLIKSPKLYFHDTGLICALLNLSNKEQLSTHYLRGEIFENMVINEFIKNKLAEGKVPELYFWRDSNHNEIDLLFEQNGNIHAAEIKSAATLNSRFLIALKHFQTISQINKQNLYVVYGGDMDYQTSDGTFISWKHTHKLCEYINNND